jgi:hypothetical protein
MAAKYFEINGVKLKLEFYKLYYWCEKMGNRKLKNPRWKEKKLTKTHGYLITIINYERFSFHRIVYYAYNQDWDITFNYNNTIDHIDRNPLNNNIFNLRIANNREQILNRDITINAKGYYYNKKRQTYYPEITLNNKKICLGYYKTEQEASNKYKKVKLFIKVLQYIYGKKKQIHC